MNVLQMHSKKDLGEATQGLHGDVECECYNVETQDCYFLWPRCACVDLVCVCVWDGISV